jgi:hypothetical protein
MSALQEPIMHPRTGLVHQRVSEFSTFNNIRYDNKLNLSAQIDICRKDVIIKIPQFDITSISYNNANKELNISVFDGYSLILSEKIIKKIIITTMLDFETCRRNCYAFDITTYLQNSRNTIAETYEFKSLCLVVKINDDLEHGGVVFSSSDSSNGIEGGKDCELNANIILTHDENLEHDEKWLMINNIRKIYATSSLPYITIEFIDYGLTCGHASQTETICINKASCTKNGVLYTYKK